VILPEVDEELDQLKRTLDGLDHLLNEVAAKLSEKMPSDLRASLNVIYFPQIGFLVTVPVDPDTGNAVYAGSFDNAWEQMFTTELRSSPKAHREYVLTYAQCAGLFQDQRDARDGRPFRGRIWHHFRPRD
jgi:hypothetical protein